MRSPPLGLVSASTILACLCHDTFLSILAREVRLFMSTRQTARTTKAMASVFNFGWAEAEYPSTISLT